MTKYEQRISCWNGWRVDLWEKQLVLLQQSEKCDERDKAEAG